MTTVGDAFSAIVQKRTRDKERQRECDDFANSFFERFLKHTQMQRDRIGFRNSEGKYITTLSSEFGVVFDIVRGKRHEGMFHVTKFGESFLVCFFGIVRFIRDSEGDMDKLADEVLALLPYMEVQNQE
jgi:hypothetical protein